MTAQWLSQWAKMTIHCAHLSAGMSQVGFGHANPQNLQQLGSCPLSSTVCLQEICYGIHRNNLPTTVPLQHIFPCRRANKHLHLEALGGQDVEEGGQCKLLPTKSVWTVQVRGLNC